MASSRDSVSGDAVWIPIRDVVDGVYASAEVLVATDRVAEATSDAVLSDSWEKPVAVMAPIMPKMGNMSEYFVGRRKVIYLLLRYMCEIQVYRKKSKRVLRRQNFVCFNYLPADVKFCKLSFAPQFSILGV